MERNTVFMTLTFYILLAALLIRLGTFLALRLYFSGLSTMSFKKTAALALHGHPPLAIAKQYNLLVGPERYSIRDCPEYDFAFRTLSLGDELSPLMDNQVRQHISSALCRAARIIVALLDVSLGAQINVMAMSVPALLSCVNVSA